MKIIIGSDHNGLGLKNDIKQHLSKRGIGEILDIGTFTRDKCDYPDIAKLVADEVIMDKFSVGILVCGTGTSMGIAANKVQGIRAVTVSNLFSAYVTKAHNNANILCLGERTTSCNLATTIVDVWLDTKFEGGQHQKRIDKIYGIEKFGSI